MTFVLAALSFLKSPLGRYLMIALAVVGLLALVRHQGYAAGEKHEQTAEAARLVRARAVVAKREAVASQITTAAHQQLVTEQERVRVVTRTITERVPVYVTPAADSRCIVPVGFVRLHDAAASGSAAGLPAAPGGPSDAPSGVALSAVADTLTANYGAAYEWRAEAMTWRTWYADQKAAWDRR